MSKKRKTQQERSCLPYSTSEHPTYTVIVEAYIHECRDLERTQGSFYRQQKNFEEAIRVSALARMNNGKRHSHQRRIPAGALHESMHRLLARQKELQKCTGFSELHELVEEIIRPIPGIGELTVYDTAQRIGQALNLEPELVYVHAGVRDGAEALGFGRNMSTIRPDELPEPFSQLKPAEIEDCMCIFKDDLQEIAKRSR